MPTNPNPVTDPTLDDLTPEVRRELEYLRRRVAYADTAIHAAHRILSPTDPDPRLDREVNFAMTAEAYTSFLGVHAEPFPLIGTKAPS